MEIIVVSGLSGSGKSVALGMLEDLEWYCLDNVPSRLLSLVLGELTSGDDPKFRQLAVGLDARPRPEDLPVVQRLLTNLRSSEVNLQLLYLHASDSVLIQRYLDTRRRHPQSIGQHGERTLADAIAYERRLLGPLSECADLVVDTTTLSVHELRELVRQRVVGRPRQQVSLLFESFGFRHGLPRDADYVFDARFLPNPYWEPSLRALSGRDQAVHEYLSRHEEVIAYVDSVAAFIDEWLPRIEAANRSYLTIAVGCTGGRHRSVWIVERLADRFRQRYPDVQARHSALHD
jgi:UPF0042 nucleotide-binding protein